MHTAAIAANILAKACILINPLRTKLIYELRFLRI